MGKGYGYYLHDIRSIYQQLVKLLKPKGKVVVEGSRRG